MQFGSTGGMHAAFFWHTTSAQVVHACIRCSQGSWGGPSDPPPPHAASEIASVTAAAPARAIRFRAMRRGYHFWMKSSASYSGRISISLSSPGIGSGQRRTHSTASSIDRTCQIQ